LLKTRDWEDKEGVKRYMTEVVCENLTMLGSKRDGGSAGTSNAETQVDDDLPF